MCDVTVIENKPRVYFISVLLGVLSYRCTDSTVVRNNYYINYLLEFMVCLFTIQSMCVNQNSFLAFARLWLERKQPHLIALLMNLLEAS